MGGRRKRSGGVACGLAALALALSLQAGPSAAQAPSAAGQTAAVSKPPRIAAKAWILVDPRDGEVLASKAPDRELPIASATKLMTAYLALHKLKPSRTLRAAPYRAAAAESLLGLRAGEKMTARDLLYALMLPSANDAAQTLAVGIAGSVPRFVAQMNRQADALGLTETSYTTPIGLDDPGNFSSASDLVDLAATLLQDPLFARVVDTQSTTLSSGDRPRRIVSRNTLLGRDPSVDGVKTGHTIGAGYVLVGSATRDGTRLISAVLGTGSEAARDAETLKLFDYGFSLYRSESPVEAGEELADPELDYRGERLPLVAKRAITISARQGQAIETEIDAPDELSGEIAEGEPLGKVTVSVDGKPAASSALVASRAAEAATLADKAVATAQNPLILIPGGAFVIVVGLLLAGRGRRSEEEPEASDPARRRERGPRERSPEERRKMHEERMRRRREQTGRRDERR